MPRFLHAADIHIDSPLIGLSLGDAEANDTVRAATRRAFERLMQLAVSEGVRFVVLAGDVLDGRDSSFESTVFLYKQVGRLFRDHGIRTYMVRGNHDPDSYFPRKLEPPEGFHVFRSEAAESFEVPGESVVLHGQSYPTNAVTENLVPGYGAPVLGKLNVGVLHTALSPVPRDGHAPYAPTSLAELASKGYAYWALGHVHTRAEYRQEGTIAVFPGNLQSRHAREADRVEHPAATPQTISGRGATVVDYEGTNITGVRHVPCDVVRWLWLRVDVSACVDRRTVRDAFAEAMRVATRADRAVDAPTEVVVRLELHGKTACADELLTHRDELRRELDTEGSLLGGEIGRRVSIESLTMTRLARPEELSGYEELIEEARRELRTLTEGGSLRAAGPIADIARIIGSTHAQEAIPEQLGPDLENEVLAYLRDALTGGR